MRINCVIVSVITIVILLITIGVMLMYVRLKKGNHDSGHKKKTSPARKPDSEHHRPNLDPNHEGFMENKFNYGPNACFDKLGSSGLLINKDNITKYGHFGWGHLGDAIPQYYQQVLRKSKSNINIYIPHCDFDPLVGQLGHTTCAKSIGYKNIQRYHDYISYLKKKFGDNVYLGTSCLYKGKSYYAKTLTIPCYDSLFRGILPFQQDVVNKHPWHTKKTGLVWRGGCSGECQVSIRRRVVNMLWDRPDCDVKLSPLYCEMPFDQKYIGQEISKEHQLRYKFILCLDGNSWPSNLEWVFFSGCVPVIICDYHMWFYKYLKPGYHFVEINSDLSNLLTVVDDLLTNPEKYKQISLNAQVFARKYLQPRAIKTYIHQSIM